MAKESKKKTKATKEASFSRPPAVVVLGHIDHGKTTLLDYIRKSQVAGGEEGGITQSIGAYVWESPEDSSQEITFIDTPGHSAFSQMRQRGADVADLGILVVAADDGVKPQTREAIAHAKSAELPLVVAVNKMDAAQSGALAKIKGQLAKEGVVSEDQGGNTPVVAVSAKTGEGVDELLEIVILSAELLELESKPEGKLLAVVIESQLSSKQGPLATVVVKEGTLKVGDDLVSGETEGRVKALIDDEGERVKEASPGYPVQILGFSDVPEVGSLITRKGEGEGKEDKKKPKKEKPSEEGGLNVILRADTRGSLEAVISALADLEVKEKKVNIVFSGVGAVSESDVRLAASSSGLVLGFNVSVVPSAQKLADDLGIGVKSFSIIYNLLEAVEKLLAGAYALEEEKKPPKAEVKKVFTLHSGDHVAGVEVLRGEIKYKDRALVFRDEEQVHQARVGGLKEGEKEVSKIGSGKEGGVLLKPDFEFKRGDLIVINFN